LDGLACEARKTLQGIQKESGLKSVVFGKDCATVNVVGALSKMRYKNGTGDPKGFKNFMKVNGIKSQMIPRYVGNRMYILFHLSGTFYFLQDKLMVYLEKFCNCNSPFKPALIKDLSNVAIVIHLKALGRG
jgi:hypothetical protein